MQILPTAAFGKGHCLKEPLAEVKKAPFKENLCPQAVGMARWQSDGGVKKNQRSTSI